MASSSLPQTFLNLTCSIRPLTSFSHEHPNLTSFCKKKSDFSTTHCKSIYLLKKNEFSLRNETMQRGDVIVVRHSGGEGGRGRGDDGAAVRVIGNIALAVGLTYLSVTGQFRWVLDAIVSIWLIVVIVPIIGLGAFLWWAGRDIIQGKCPNCGNEFQIFKSTINEELQLCPFCSQPFSVVGNKFVSDPVNFSNKTAAGQAFEDFPPRPQNENVSSTAVVDIEAEVKDAD